MTIDASRFVDRHLKIVRKRLKGISRGVSDCGDRRLLPSIRVTSGLCLARSRTGGERLLTLDGRVSATGCVHTRLSKGSLDRALPAGSKVSGSGVRKLVIRCGSVMLGHGHLGTGDDRGGPLMRSVRASLGDVHRAVVRSMSGLVISLGARVKDVHRRRVTAAGRLSSNPGRTGCLLSMRQRRGIGRTLCLCLLRGHRRGRLSRTFATCGAEIVATPQNDVLPAFPHGVGVLLITIVLNLLIPTLVVFVGRGVGAGIQKHGSLRGLAVPFINRVPLCSRGGEGKGGKHRGGSPIIIDKKGHGVVGRTFQILHSGVSFIVNGSGGGGIVLFASFGPKDNGSFVSVGVTVYFTLGQGGILIVSNSVHRNALSSRIRSPRGKLDSCLDTRASS